MTRKSSRRDFLKGKSAVEAITDRAREAVSRGGLGLWPDPSMDDSYLIRISRRAMACQFEVILNAGQYASGTETSLRALDLVAALEDQMTVFGRDSEISRLNRAAAEGPVEVEPRLFELLELARQLHAETEGAFDITSGPLWKAWGFARHAGAVPTEGQLARAMQNVGSHLVELDAERRAVRFRQAGVELNLGGIGKGYALDRCGELLTAAGIQDFLVHGGQSSVLARGSKLTGAEGAREKTFGWVIGARHPLRRGQRLAELRLRDRAMATSGSAVQYFRRQGRQYGHILDPRTGQPAEGVFSATVAAPSAAVADALSTAFYVMGADKAAEHCRSRPQIAALMVCPADRSPGFEIHSFGFEEDELRILEPLDPG